MEIAQFSAVIQFSRSLLHHILRDPCLHKILKDPVALRGVLKMVVQIERTLCVVHRELIDCKQRIRMQIEKGDPSTGKKTHRNTTNWGSLSAHASSHSSKRAKT